MVGVTGSALTHTGGSNSGEKRGWEGSRRVKVCVYVMGGVGRGVE